MHLPSAGVKTAVEEGRQKARGKKLGPDKNMKLSAKELLHARFSELVVSRGLQEATQTRNFKH